MRWINFLKKKKCSSNVIRFFFSLSNTSMENSWFWNIWHSSILNYTYESKIISLFFRVKCVYWFNHQRNSNSICGMPSEFFIVRYMSQQCVWCYTCLLWKCPRALQRSNMCKPSSIATCMFIIFVHHLFFIFFFCWQPVEVVKEKEREKRRERNLNERESQKSNFFWV